MICKHINSTHRWDPNRYYHFGQSEPGSDGNEGVLNTPQISRTGASPSDPVEYPTKDITFLPLRIDE